MIPPSMRERHDAASLELRIYDRFRIICTEIARDLQDFRKGRSNPVLDASTKGLVEIGIAMLKRAEIRKQDWDAYLEQAFISASPDLLRAAIEIMPHGSRLPQIEMKFHELAHARAPQEHLYLAVDAGLAANVLTKKIVQKVISERNAPLKKALITSLEKGGGYRPMSEWFVYLREDTMAKDPEFIGSLIDASIALRPDDANRAFGLCIQKKRGLHAALLHLSGATPSSEGAEAWSRISRHHLLKALGNATTPAALLRDKGATTAAARLLEN